MSTNKKLGNISIYAAGGSGINIATMIEKAAVNSNLGFAKINTFYVDTSYSNITKDHAPEQTYILENLDGSGKVRAENHVQIGECVHDVLLRHKPGDLSIVISSASGGSGSVIAPSLVNELIARQQMVIVIAIGSRNSRIEIDNTIKTLKSYEAISQRNKTPVPMVYVENLPGKRRADTDLEVQKIVSKLAALFSRQNDELDSADLRNWLNYNKVTSYDPHLVALDTFVGDTYTTSGTIITIASLAKAGDDTSLSKVVEYQCVGFISKEALENISINEPLHFVIIGDVFAEVIKGLSKTLNELDEVKRASVRKVNILSNNDNATDNGIIL